MQNHIKAANWLDRTEYPFRSNYFKTEQGNIHYLDEGRGEVLLFVHGTPTWSFLYRNFIKKLSKSYRCIAIDHLGFGLSDKPKDFVGTPKAHSRNLEGFIDHLNLKDITLVVHDFGGPIGLSYAIESPENINRIVLFNTWLWETKNDKNAQKIDKILHSKFGNFIYLNTNFSPVVLFRKAFFDKKCLSKNIHNHYRKIFPNKSSRYGLLNIGKSLLGSSDWYEDLWSKAEVLRNKPVLIIWGVRDEFIKKNNLEKWQQFFKNQQSHLLEAGHFVQEEKKAECIDIISQWLDTEMKATK